MHRVGRRRFLTVGGLSLGACLVPLAARLSSLARARDYGALVPDPDGLLDLPAGFSYTVLQEASGTMTDGYRVPGLPDGMGCFLGSDGNWVLMRNHEVGVLAFVFGAYGLGEAPPEAFTDNAFGCVTRMVVDPKTHALVSSNLVLTGTSRNCAGGVSPWGWLTCEEAGDDADHGYVFVCDIEATSVQSPVQVLGYGRFHHEAAAVDPATHVCYLTEDRGDGCLYRFVPLDPCEPFVGRLQALRVVGEDGAVTAEWATGDMAAIDWVDIDEPNPEGDTVRAEAAGKGAALFRRGEGIWFHDGQVWFSSTNGGPANSGQIFRLTDGRGGGSLELVTQSDDANILDFPDNITIAPWGQLFMCEDGDGDNFIRVLTEQGEVRPFARNQGSDSELAGACFSPDGTVLFVNIQRDGLTLAITGPFPAAPQPSGDVPDCDGGADTGESGAADTSGGGESGTTGADAGEGGSDTDASAGTSGGLGGSDESGASAGVDGDGGEGCGCATGGPGDAAGAAITAVILAAVLPRDR